MGKNIRGSWACNDCMTKRTVEATLEFSGSRGHSQVVGNINSLTLLLTIMNHFEGDLG